MYCNNTSQNSSAIDDYNRTTAIECHMTCEFYKLPTIDAVGRICAMDSELEQINNVSKNIRN